VKLLRHSSARYVLAGGFLFVIDFVVYFALARILGVEPGVAQFVSRGTGATVGFFVHRDFSFRTDGAARSASIASQGSGYTLVTIANLMGSPFLVHWSVSILDGRVALGKLVVDAFLIVESYVALRFLFRSRYPDTASPDP
jgi:putative flippase GtrA